jgi:hypothetical protein
MKSRHARLGVALGGAVLVFVLGSARLARSNDEAAHVAAATPLDAGRYLVKVTGCNECHTKAWEETNGHVPETQWLTGGTIPHSPVAAPNLRTIVAGMSKDRFVALFRTPQPPQPMPFQNFRDMPASDVGAIYDFIASLR